MKYEKILLKKLTNINVGDEAYVEIYLNKNNPETNSFKRNAMVVIPGGGYAMCSQRESDPIALRYLAEGFNCFVLNYTTNVCYPEPQLELAIFIDYIVKHAEELEVYKDHISIVGFSAGGHLTASYALLYEELAKMINVEASTIRPHSILLGYPVTTFEVTATHSFTKGVITNGNDETLVKKLTIPENVTSNYPPTYIWTTKEDVVVPPVNSIMLYENLKTKGVKCRLDLYEHGIHGGSLCSPGVYRKEDNIDFDAIRPNREWIDNSIDFILSLDK